MATNNLWTRDEMILVLNLYLKIPFGKMHKGNPNVIKMAHLIGRTPDAVVIVWLIMRPMIRNLNKEESPECHTEEKNVKNIGMNL